MAGFLFFIFFAWIMPIILAWKIAKDKNRSVAKALFITLFFGWFAVIGLWLILKTRDLKTNQLY